MKSLYLCVARLLAFFILFTTLSNSAKSQILSTGDIVFTGYQSTGSTTNTDQFAFVPLVNLPNGTTIKFTDNGWNGAALGAVSTESIVTFTTTALIVAGREIRIVLGPPAGAFNANGTAVSATVSVSGTISLPSTGDQIFAYQGPDNVPTTFIAGIQMNIDAGATAATWDPSNTGTNNSVKPAALTSGSTALWPPAEHDNGKFNACGANLSTPAAVRTAVNDPNNWLFDDLSGSNPPPFGIMSGCSFLGLRPLPVTLAAFTGKLNSDKSVTLQWKVELQQNIKEYIIEKSTDGSNFISSASVPANNLDAYTYSLTDIHVATGNNFYRLKIVGLDNKISYSEVILINLKAGLKVNVYPNPVIDKLVIQQFGTIQYKSAVLSNGEGRVLQQVSLTEFVKEINMKIYSAGLYLLKLDDGTVFKILKQ